MILNHTQHWTAGLCIQKD